MSALTTGINSDYRQQHIPIPIRDKLQGQSTWVQDVPRKDVHRQGSLVDITQARTSYDQARAAINLDIDELKHLYVFADDSVAQSLTNHRALRTILREAITPLKALFGDDNVFRLEITREESGFKTFYVVAIWKDNPEAARAVIDRFDDEWWLSHMTSAVSNLSFTYEYA